MQSQKRTIADLLHLIAQSILNNQSQEKASNANNKKQTIEIIIWNGMPMNGWGQELSTIWKTTQWSKKAVAAFGRENEEGGASTETVKPWNM